METQKPIFICEFKACERIFTTKYSLIRHMHIHLKKKNFECKEWKKTFTIKQNLIEHEFVHTGQQPYVWNIDGCSQRFRQRGKLSIHRQGHKTYHKKIYRSHTLINDGEQVRKMNSLRLNRDFNTTTIPTPHPIQNNIFSRMFKI